MICGPLPKFKSFYQIHRNVGEMKGSSPRKILSESKGADENENNIFTKLLTTFENQNIFKTLSKNTFSCRYKKSINIKFIHRKGEKLRI